MDPSLGLHNGKLGTGQLVIVGNRATISTAAGYWQNGRSRLTFVLRDESGLDVSEIRARVAKFEPGALIDMVLEGVLEPAGSFWGPAGGGGTAGGPINTAGWAEQKVLLVETTNGPIAMGLDSTDPLAPVNQVLEPNARSKKLQQFLDPADRSTWRLVLENSDRRLSAVYCPNQYDSGPCSQ